MQMAKKGMPFLAMPLVRAAEAAVYQSVAVQTPAYPTMDTVRN